MDAKKREIIFSSIVTDGDKTHEDVYNGEARKINRLEYLSQRDQKIESKFMQCSR